MTRSYSSRARVKRTLQARRGLFTLVIVLAFLLSPVNQPWGALASTANPQAVNPGQAEGPNLGARQNFSATITTPMLWTTEQVTYERLFNNMGDHSLRLDSTGKAHVAFGGDHLYYASFDGTNWSGETIDFSDNVGQFTSLYIDGDDHPHISYYDAHYGSLKYARNLGGGWEVYTIAKWWATNEGFIDDRELTSNLVPPEEYSSPADWQYEPAEQIDFTPAESFTTIITDTRGVGLYTSITLDANGNPYISYYDALNGDLKCARQMLGQWYVDTVDSDGVTGLYTSIAVDTSSPVKIYISYYDYTNGNLRYAVWNGSKWSRITADAVGNVGQYTSLALDHADRVRISYYDATNKDLKYTYWTGSTFVPTKVDGTGIDVGMYSSIALRDGRNPHISYYDATHGTLRYAGYSDAGWTVYTLATDELSGKFSSIVLDPDNSWYPRITYYSSVVGQLKYVARTGASTWSYSVIDTAHNQGAYVSMDLDSAERPHMAFFDDVADILEYAYWDGANWQVEVVDDKTGVGMYASLVLDAADVPHISYFDDAAKRLRYATRSGGGWQIENADTATGVGEYTSIALGLDGLPYISYYDKADKNLRLTHKLANGTWEVFIVDSTDNVGKYSSLAIDSAGVPHLSYYNETNELLKYAKLEGGTWQKYVIGQNGSVGLFTSMVLDSGDNPHIAYFRDDNDTLMYAYFSGGSWTIQRLDECGAKQEFDISLTLDGSNNPYISHVRGDSLRVARWTGSQWIVQTVDVPGDIGRFSSIKALSSGYPVIAYYDATNGDLKYATAHFAYQTFLPYLNR